MKIASSALLPELYRKPILFVREIRDRLVMADPPITQGQLARAAGMSASQLSRYLRFRVTPGVVVMDRLHSALTRLERAGME